MEEEKTPNEGKQFVWKIPKDGSVKAKNNILFYHKLKVFVYFFYFIFKTFTFFPIFFFIFDFLSYFYLMILYH